jgi:hypothetical protein
MSVMSNSVKTKFAGLLRGLLNRLDENNGTVPQTPRVSTSTAFPHPAPPVSRPPSPAPTFTPLPLPAENPDELQLPLQPILAVLPMDLRAKVIQAPLPDAMISVPLGKIMTQLAFGSVKLTFGELRRAAPDVFVNSGGEHDNKPVMLPLNEILTRLNPSLLSRRPTQKHIEVAEEIAGPFGVGGEGAKISVAAKPTPSTAMTPRTDSSALRMVAPVAPAQTGICAAHRHPRRQRPGPTAIPVAQHIVAVTKHPIHHPHRRASRQWRAKTRLSRPSGTRPAADSPNFDGSGDHFRAADRPRGTLAGRIAT